MGLDYNALVDKLSGQSGISGIVITQVDGTPLAQKDVSDGECALVAFAGDAVRESCKAFAMGDIDNVVITGSDYKLIVSAGDEVFIGAFTDASRDADTVISAIRSA